MFGGKTKEEVEAATEARRLRMRAVALLAQEDAAAYEARVAAKIAELEAPPEEE